MSALPPEADKHCRHQYLLSATNGRGEENPSHFSNRAFFHDRFIGFAERGPLRDGDDSKLLRHATCDELFRMAVRKKHAVVILRSSSLIDGFTPSTS